MCNFVRTVWRTFPYKTLGWDLAIARYQPRPCGQQRGFAPTFFWKIFGKSIFSEIFLVNFFGKIFLAAIFCFKKNRENMFEKNSPKIFPKKYLCQILKKKVGAKPPCCPQGLGWYWAIARSQPSIIIFLACQLSMLMLHPPSHFHETATQLNNFVSKNGTHKVYVCAVFVYAGSVS